MSIKNADHGSTVNLSELTPFQWDAVYSFDPYTDKNTMSSAIGFHSPVLEESVSEDMVSIVFINENQVVCSICDFPWRTGYFLGLGHFEDGRSFRRLYPENGTLTILQDVDSCMVLKLMGEIFEGKVEKISGASALISIDEGFPIRASGDQVCIYLTEELQKEIKVGDHVKVRYDGMVLETSPLQLAGQMGVEIQKQASKS